MDRTRILHRIGWLLAELAVVFAGVTGAFLLSEWRAERQNEERRRQIVEAVREHIGAVNQDVERLYPQFDRCSTSPS